MRIRSGILILSIFITSSMFSQTAIPLDTVLKRSMSAAEKYNGLVENYTADVYMRTYVETLKKNFLFKYTHLVPRFVLHDPKSDEALIETLSTLSFTYPNNYLQDIKNVPAEHQRLRRNNKHRKFLYARPVFYCQVLYLPPEANAV